MSIFLLYSIVSIAQADLLSGADHVSVTEMDMDVLLEIGPVSAQRKLLKDKKRLKANLEQLYIKKSMARMAETEGLAQRGMNAVRLQAVIDNALYLLKLDQVRLSDKKDYTKFAKQLYLVHQEDYKVAERVDAAHILISTKERTDEEALKKAQKLREELMSGSDFSELALRDSDDSSVKKNKGQLGAFVREQMVKEFSDAAFSLQVGELSKPIRTQFGYHLIKVNKKIPAGFKSFDEVKEGIIDDLKKKDWKIRREEFFQQLKKSNKIQFNDKAIDEYISKKLELL